MMSHGDKNNKSYQLPSHYFGYLCQSVPKYVAACCPGSLMANDAAALLPRAVGADGYTAKQGEE